MRMIAGFIAPSAGQVSVCGYDIERAPVAAKSCMGYLPEGAPSYGEVFRTSISTETRAALTMCSFLTKPLVSFQGLSLTVEALSQEQQMAE